MDSEEEKAIKKIEQYIKNMSEKRKIENALIPMLLFNVTDHLCDMKDKWEDYAKQAVTFFMQANHPILFEAANNIYQIKKKEKNSYIEARQVFKETTSLYIADINKQKEAKRHMRLYKVCKDIYDYFGKNKFDTRKCNLILVLWALELDENGHLETFVNEYRDKLKEIYDGMQKGFEVIKNFDLIYKSAKKQFPKIHKLAQKRGYYDAVIYEER